MKRLLTVKLLSLCAVLSVEAQSDVWRSDSLQEVLKLGVPLLQDAETDVELVDGPALEYYHSKNPE